MSTPGRIVVGVDGSDASRDALRWAAHQAELTGSHLEIIMTWELPGSTWAIPLPENVDFEADAREALRRVVHETLGPDVGESVTALVQEGHAAPVLVDASNGADLVVVGSHGRGAFAGMVLGSVSSHVVSHARCPVVVVRHLGDEGETTRASGA